MGVFPYFFKKRTRPPPIDDKHRTDASRSCCLDGLVQVSKVLGHLCIFSKKRQPGFRLHSWKFVILVRFDDAVFAILTAIHDIGCIRLSVCEYEEVVAKHIHLKNCFLTIHRFQIKTLRTN